MVRALERLVVELTIRPLLELGEIRRPAPAMVIILVQCYRGDLAYIVAGLGTYLVWRITMR